MSKPRPWKKVPMYLCTSIYCGKEVLVADIANELADIPRRTLNYHSKLPLTADLHYDRRHNNKGRPNKLNDGD